MISAAQSVRKVRSREYEMRRGREASAAANETGYIPFCKDLGRRKACGESLHEFLISYFPHSTGLSPLGPDQRAAVERIQVALQEEGWISNIMPRGFTKSTISENAILWAMLYGYRKYCLFFAGTSVLAEKGIASISRELLCNDLLYEDFPEVCLPIRKTELKALRCTSQTYQGKPTGMIAKQDILRLPNIPGFEGAGGIIEAHGLLAPPRGARFKDESGANVRPDVAVIDDPSTDNSSKSLTQNESRLRFIKNSISMMGRHGGEMTIIVNATILNDGDLADQLSDPEVSPEIQSVRIPMVKKMPDTLDSLWLTEYASIRRQYDRENPRGRIIAKQKSTEFLKAHYDEMHAGSGVSWENIGLESTEISALQHAMNILIDKGPDTFFAECQNAPLRPQGISTLRITEEVEERLSGFKRFIVPNDTSFLVFGIDVHAELLYYTVTAVKQDFTGRIVHYGTFPEQESEVFTLRSANFTLSRYYDLAKKSDTERAVELGVTDLVSMLLNQGWVNNNGEPVGINAGCVDIGYKKTEVANALRRCLPASQIVLMSRGVGIGATRKPMREYDLSPGRVLRFGPDVSDPRWLLPTSGRDGSLYECHFDTNFWKTVLAKRLTQTGSEARWELFEDQDTTQHTNFVSHLMAESIDQVHSNGRTVDQWSLKSGRDNHWFDSTVMCAVAASLCGAQLPVAQTTEKSSFTPSVVASPKRPVVPNKGPNGQDFFVSAREMIEDMR